MRDYGKVHTSFWASANIRSMSEDGRHLALYLLTCPHGTIAGTFRLPDGYVCEDLQWSSERVSKGFAELFANGFANRCETTKWVWVVKHLEWNPPENPNQRKSAAKVVGQIPDSCGWKADFMRVCGESLGLDVTEFIKRHGTVKQPLPNQEQEQEQKQEQDKGRSAEAQTEPPTGAELLPAVASATAPEKFPPPERTTDTETALQAACRETWTAYSTAYTARYSAAPVRNAKVNANVKQFVQRLGTEEAPLVAAWFVEHPGGYYVGRCHDFGALLSDAEKLRTEWATGKVVTATTAKQSDRRGAMASAVSNLLAQCGGDA